MKKEKFTPLQIQKSLHLTETQIEWLSGAQSFFAHCSKFCDIEPEKLSLLEPFFAHRVYKKKEILLREGERCDEKFFILKGCTHLYYLKQDGTEQTIDFAIENWWTSDFMAFQHSSTAKFSIRAIEVTEVLCLSYEQQQRLLIEAPELNAYFHLMFQKAYAAAQMRFRMLYELSKENLYLDFSRNFPAFIQRVPQYLLASFLGFTPEYLSEIRKRFIS